jgi:hypothetical protein
MAIYNPPTVSSARQDQTLLQMMQNRMAYDQEFNRQQRRSRRENWNILANLPAQIYETYQGVKEKERAEEDRQRAEEDRQRGIKLERLIEERAVEAAETGKRKSLRTEAIYDVRQLEKMPEEKQRNLALGRLASTPYEMTVDETVQESPLGLGVGIEKGDPISALSPVREDIQRLPDGRLAVEIPSVVIGGKAQLHVLTNKEESERLSESDQVALALDRVNLKKAQQPKIATKNVFAEIDGDVLPVVAKYENGKFTGYEQDLNGRYIFHQDEDAPTLEKVENWNSKTGQMEISWVEQELGATVPYTLKPEAEKATEEKEPSQSQWDAGRYGYDTKQGAKYIDEAFKDIVGDGKDTWVEKVLKTLGTKHGMLLPYSLQPEPLRRYLQGAQLLINAQLRRESGAAISVTEFDNARGRYLPVPGDSDDLLEQKRETRESRYQIDILEAGPSWNQYKEYRANLEMLGERRADPETGKITEWRQDEHDERQFGWAEVQD